MSKVLLKYIPETALPLIRSWFNEYNFHLRISKSRSSKYGDFRPSLGKNPHRISVNGDLNQFHFLFTLTHEVAHVAIWQQYKNRVNPHGIQWKKKYSELLTELLSRIIIPEDLERAVNNHLKRPKASSCSDPELFRALKKYDSKNSYLCLEEISEGTIFNIQDRRIFKKGKKRRTRFECIEIKSKKTYLINGHAEVKLVD